MLVYRTVSKKWEGPFRYISCEGETVVVQLDVGRKIFRTTCVKPYVLADFGHQSVKIDRDEKGCCDEDKPTIVNTIEADGPEDDYDLGTTPRKVVVKKGSREEKAFAKSRKDELVGLLEGGTFKPVKESTVPPSSRIFGSRFVDELKKVGNGLRKKSRLVAQNYADDDATSISTKAPTIQRFSQRVALSVAASIPSLKGYVRDVTQAYIQSHTHLERDVFIKAPSELDLPPGHVLRVVKPLYGIPESGLHWYLTYLAHHLDTLGMTRSRVDPCLLIKQGNNGLDGFILLQVDDSLGFGTEQFLDEEERASLTFKCKARAPLTNKPTTFNGITITKGNQIHVKDKTQQVTGGQGESIEWSGKDIDAFRYSISQRDKIGKLGNFNDQSEFVSQRALAQYIGVNIRPDIYVHRYSSLHQVSHPPQIRIRRY